MATIPTPEQGKPILDFSAGTFDGNSNLFQSRNGATEHVSGDDVADYVNTSRVYNGLKTELKTPVGAINEIKAQEESDIADVQAAIDELESVTTGQATLDTTKIDGGGIVYTKVGKIVIVDVNIRFKANIAADSAICSGLPSGSFVHFLLGASQNIYRAYFDRTTIKLSDVPPATYCTGMFVYKAN